MRHRGLPARPVRPAVTQLRHLTRTRLRQAVAVGCAASVVVAGSAFALSLTSATAAPSSTASPLPTITVAPAPLPSITATAAPTKPVAKTTPAKRLTLAELRVAVAKADADLEVRTRAFEDGKKKLAASKARLVVVQAAATAARAEAAKAHVDLGKYAAAAYRGQQISPVVTVLMGPPAAATDTLRNLENLEQTGEIKTDITTYAAQTAARAAALEAEAAALTSSNAASAYELEVQRNEVKFTAEDTQKQLVAEMRRIAAAQARVAAKNCIAKAKLAATFPNGLIPAEALCTTGIGSFMLRGDAAIAFRKLAVAYKAEFDKPICLNSAYRDRALQARLFAGDPVMVALPGRSHHGLGLATDLCGGIEKFGSPQHEWMKENAADYGFFHPAWAEPNGVTPEPWHWEFKVASYPSNDGTAPTPAASATAGAQGT